MQPAHTEQVPPAGPGPSARRQAGWFVVVGALATGVHWAVVVGLVEQAGARPLPANVVGWLTAVGVSFAGHHWLSFRGHRVPVASAAGRFLVISASGFAINQAAYALLLAHSGQSYAVLLGAVLAGMAVCTFAASRWWAFAHRPRA
jgi:putative flippase GtrA